MYRYISIDEVERQRGREKFFVFLKEIEFRTCKAFSLNDLELGAFHFIIRCFSANVVEIKTCAQTLTTFERTCFTYLSTTYFKNSKTLM